MGTTMRQAQEKGSLWMPDAFAMASTLLDNELHTKTRSQAHANGDSNTANGASPSQADWENHVRLCVATAAHDLSNPLAAAANAARALKSGNVPAEEWDFWMDCLVRNLTSMQFLVEDFHDFACRHNGELVLRHQVLDLWALANEVVRDCGAILPTHELSCEGASGWINGDSERLKRLLFNLLTNAVKYSENGTQVRVEVWPRDSQVCLFVHDQGKGIPPAETERIFLPFTRLNPTADCAGDGLGLASVKRIADAHGAAVLVQGASGQGTTFEICFPAAAQPTA